MRTRRSPRNQQILWRELGGPAGPKPEPAPPRTAEEIDAMWWLSKRTRAMLKRDLVRQQQAAKVRAALAPTDHEGAKP